MTAGQTGGLIRDIADLVQILQKNPPIDRDSALTALTVSAVSAMPGAQSAGITLASRAGTVESSSATGRYPEILDQIQQRHEQGPCLSAAWEHHTVHVDDMRCEKRWPYFCIDALAETPVRSVMSFRIFSDRHHAGALNFFADAPRAFDQDAAEVGRFLASHVAVAWSMVLRDEQFRSALASRDLIGQAKGMLMERFNIDAAQAFGLLKRISQSSNTPVAVVARRLVASEHPAK